MDKSSPLAICHSNEDDEDTLSLSDLPIYGDQNLKFWVEDTSTSSYDTEQDFEFSSEMMITSHDSSKPIVFCGKIIHVSSQNIENFESKKKKKQKCYKHTANTNVVRKVSMLASKTKSRWYLIMIGFGSSRIPKEMHINDLRKRGTSQEKKCNDYCDECDTSRMRTRGFLKFFGCGGGCSGTKDDETLCKHRFQIL
uniref:Uncharacterized protein n=1 Tax=Tanacetum cinerariifolium TaxID=118510 RepID=A0A6L2LFI6_TANCI|nr:hypothetical protein [Tanacetum cinerariifolium]